MNATRRELLALKYLTVLIVGDTSFKQEIRVDSNSTKPALEAVLCAGVRAQRPRVILNVGNAVSGQQLSLEITNTITGNLTIAATSEAKRMAYDRPQLALLSGGPVIPLALAPTGRAGWRPKRRL